MQTESRRSMWPRVITYVLLAAWALVCGFPLYWLVLASLTPVELLGQGPHYLPFVDFTPSFEAWRFVLTDPAESLLPGLANSLLIGLTAASLSLMAAALLLYGLTRPRTARAAQFWPVLSVFLSFRLLPPVVLALPLYVLADSFGALDTRSFLIGVYATANLPVALWLLAPVFGRKPTEQEDSALLDGATHFGILGSVLLPMLMRPLIVTGLFLFILCWNEYLFAAYLTSGHAQTLSPWVATQLSMKEAQAGGEGEELAHMAAASVLMAMPALAIAAAVQRVLARSIAAVQL